MSHSIKEKYNRVVIIDPQLKDCKGHNYRYAKGIAKEVGISAVVLSHKQFKIEDNVSIDVRPCFSFDQYDNAAFKGSYRSCFYEKVTRLKDRIFARLQQDNGIWERKSPVGILVNLFVIIGNLVWFFPALFHQIYFLVFGRGSSAQVDLAALELKASFENIGLQQGDLLIMQTMLWPTFESLLELRIQANKRYPCDALFIVHEDWTIYNTMYTRFSPAKLEKRVLESLPFNRAKIVSTNKPLSDYCQEWCDYFPQVIKEINFPLAEELPKRNIDGKRTKKILIPGVYRGDKNFEILEFLIERISSAETDVEFCMHESVLARIRPSSIGSCICSVYSSVEGAYAWLEFLNSFHLILIPYGREYRHRISGIVHEARLLNIPVVCHKDIADANLLSDARCTYGDGGEGIVEAIRIACSLGAKGAAFFRPEEGLALGSTLLDEAGWVKGRDKPIAVQVKPAWTRCGTSAVLDMQMDCLVEKGYFLVEIYLKTEPWQLRPEQIEECYQVMRAGREFSAGMAVRILFKNVSLSRVTVYIYQLLRGYIPAFFKRENIHSTWCDPDRPLIRFLKSSNVELVLVNHIFNTDFARKYIPAKKFICETHDIQINQLLLRRPELNECYDTELNYELQLLKSYDAVVNLNRIEHKIIEQAVGEKAYFIAPPIFARPLKKHYLCLKDLLSAESAFGDLDNLPEKFDLLIVADGHPANINSVTHFLDQVFPQLPRKVTLGLVGTVGKYLNIKDNLKDRIFTVGYVEDLANLHEFARVIVLPDIVGEGIPIKTNEVLARGCPFVATRHALRAFTADELEKSGIVAAVSSQEMIEQIVELLNGKKDWEKPALIMKRLYSVRNYLDNWGRLLDEIKKKSIHES